MQQANYQEKIVIPTLQKKILDLQSSNLFLEVSLLVEQNKLKDIQTFYQTELETYESKIKGNSETKNRLNSLSDENTKNIQTIEKMQNELNLLAEKIAREISIKDNIAKEYISLKNNYDLLKIENEDLKKKTNNRKKKEEVVYDGETY